MSQDVLEGITTKTTKEELLGRLRDAASELLGYRDAQTKRMQEILEKVRASAKPVDLRQIIVSSSVEEWKLTAEFLDEFEGLLPASLARVREGIRQVIEEQ